MMLVSPMQRARSVALTLVGFGAVLGAVLAAVTAAGCTNTSSRLDNATRAAPSPSQAAVAAPSVAAPSPSSPPGSGDPDERLARVERRLDKVIAVLDQAMGPAEPDPASTYAVPVNELDPIEGPRDAKVTIVEAYEFLCPFCYLANPLIDQIRAKYPNDVRVVSKYMVIHGAPAATAGAYACAAARQGKFVEMKNEIWSRLWKMENGRPQAQPDQIAGLEAVATSLGLDRGRLTKDLETCQGWLQSGSRELGAVGVNTTPTFLVNGRPLRDRSFAAFDDLVAKELAKANQSGVAAAQYYEREIVGKGLKQVKSRFAD
jgi:protein-disulfide isomerase